jgi:hypothetical protein
MLHVKESKGLQYDELGGQISFGQWFFRFAFSASLGDFGCVGPQSY